VYPLLKTKIDWKKKRADLTAKRDALFRKYSKDPHDLTLALEIKTLDDDVAECTDKMREELLADRKSKPIPAAASRN
jgi:hypothetical protein